MTRITDKILATIVIVGLTFAFFVLISNLFGFGSQEFLLQHPDFPEGPDYKKFKSNVFIQLSLWTFLTGTLLSIAIYSRISKNRKLFNKLAFATFIAATYLPVLTIINGLTARGIIMAGVTLGFAGLSLLKMNIDEKNKFKGTYPSVVNSAL